MSVVMADSGVIGVRRPVETGFWMGPVSMSENKFTFVLGGLRRATCLNARHAFVNGIRQHFEFSREVIECICLPFAEAVTNAIVHGLDDRVRVSCYRIGESFYLELQANSHGGKNTKKLNNRIQEAILCVNEACNTEGGNGINVIVRSTVDRRVEGTTFYMEFAL